MSETKEVPKGVSWKGFVVGIIIVLIITSIYSLSWPPAIFGEQVFTDSVLAAMSQDRPVHFYTMIYAIVPVILIIAIINQIKPIFSREDVTVISVMVMVAGLTEGSEEWLPTIQQFFTFVPATMAATTASGISLQTSMARYTLWKQYLSPVIFGDWTYESGIMMNSIYPDWIKIVPQIIYGFLFIMCIQLTMIFFLLIFRRLYVDQMALQFPIGFIGTQMVETTQRDGSRRVKLLSKWFLLGFIIVLGWLLIVYVPYWIFKPAQFGLSYPPDGSGGALYGLNIPLMPEIDLTKYVVIGGFWTYLLFTARPEQIGWMALLSFDTLIGIVVAYIGIYFVYAAYLSTIWGPPSPTDIPQYGTWILGRIFGWEFPNGVSFNTIAIGFGLFVGLLAYTLIYNRRTVIPALKGLLKEPPEEYDPERPFSYRFIWLAFLGFLVASIIVASIASISPLVFAVWILIFLILMIGHVRFYGESGAYFGMEYNEMNSLPMVMTVPIVLFIFNGMLWGPGGETSLSMTAVMTLVFLAPMMKNFLGQTSTLASVTFDSVKMGKNTQTSIKDLILKGVVAASAVAVGAQLIFRWLYLHILPYGYFSQVSWYYVQGGVTPVDSSIDAITNGSPALGENGWGGIGARAADIYSNMLQYPMDYGVKIALGIVIAIAIPILARRYTWLRVSVPGLILGATMGHLLFFPALIALIIRVITNRVGGINVFREKIVPICVGFIFAWALFSFVFVIANQLLANLEQAYYVHPW